MKKYHVLTLSVLAATLLSSPSIAKESIEQRLDRLEAQNRYLSDYIAIWKVQSSYTHYMNINALHDIVALFADSDEQEIELSNKGILRGRDAARRYFLRAGTPQEVKGPTSPRPAS